MHFLKLINFQTLKFYQKRLVQVGNRTQPLSCYNNILFIKVSNMKN
jgi:hypothetical protein